MMRFEDVLQDIKRLVGTRIKSIRRGADLTILEVDIPGNRVELLDAKDHRRSRSLSELQRIWERLSDEKIVHVDSALRGSGSSRNQPETILANLPYIEWLKRNGKKHISYVGEATHALGTLREMDPAALHELLSADLEYASDGPGVVVVTDDTRGVAAWLESVSGAAPEAVSPGVYRHLVDGSEVLVVGASVREGLPVGTYIALRSKSSAPGGVEVVVGGETYRLLEHGEVRLLVGPVA